MTTTSTPTSKIVRPPGVDTNKLSALPQSVKLDKWIEEAEKQSDVAKLQIGADFIGVEIRKIQADIEFAENEIKFLRTHQPPSTSEIGKRASHIGEQTGLRKALEEWQGHVLKFIESIHALPAPSAERPLQAAERLRMRGMKKILDAVEKDANAPVPDDAMKDMRAADAMNPIGGPARPARTQLKRADIRETRDIALWVKIRTASANLGWEKYSQFMDGVLCADPKSSEFDQKKRELLQPGNTRLRLPFPDVDAYRFLKVATEVFMVVNCDTWDGVLPADPTEKEAALDDVELRTGRSYTADDIQKMWRRQIGSDNPHYLVATKGDDQEVLPYLALIRNKLPDAAIVDWSKGKDFDKALAACSGILREKLESPCLLELIWSYWHEEAMLAQSVNALARRFQNIRGVGDRDPLANLEIDPLRPLSGFLWGWVQDEQHRLTVARRAYEYDHAYGLALVGKAVPGIRGADSRTRFLEAFHNLLHLCSVFYVQDDDTTVVADGFPVLNALRDVHLLLSQGAHNQYGDLPWTARQEMLMQQWLLARPELREFLSTRTMVAYPEPWMDRVDAMKTLMGWGDASVLHFRELAVFGERILLGARFNNWTEVIEPESASNWARFWRPEVQGYIHAYRAVSGVDLTERAEATMPSTLLRQRLAASRVTVR